MKETKFSLIVPIYKVEPYLKRCLDSIVNQTYKNIEVILVDDGSPDGCPKICDEYAAADNRISVIHKQNGGLMAAWIDGLKKATGEYVYFIDSDDWITLNSVSDYAEVINNCHPDLISNSFLITSSKKELIKKGMEYSKTGFLAGEDFAEFKAAFMREDFKCEYYRWNKIFKREILLNNIKFCDTKVALFEDINIVFPVMQDIKNIYLMEKPSYHYFVREDSMIRASFKERNITDRERVLKALISVLQDKNINDKELVCKLNYFFLICIIDEIIRAKVNRRQNFRNAQKSYIINNELKDILQNYLSGYRKKVYLNFVKSHFCTVRLLRFIGKLKWEIKSKLLGGDKKNKERN